MIEHTGTTSVRISYPVRNFRCPFCGARVPTEQYRGGRPWVCPGCSRPLQFSATYEKFLSYGALGTSFLCCYLLGLWGWQLIIASLVIWFPLLFIFIGIFHRFVPPRLEAYEGSVLTLFPPPGADSEQGEPEDGKDGSGSPGVPRDGDSSQQD